MASSQPQGSRPLGRRPSNLPDEVASSNATLNAFLGGRQKSWMTGGIIGGGNPHGFAKHQRPPAPQASQETQLSTTTTTTVAQETAEQISPTQAIPQYATTQPGPVSTIQPPSNSNSPLVANLVPQNSIPSFYATAQYSVLPSPAPSDETGFQLVSPITATMPQIRSSLSEAVTANRNDANPSDSISPNNQRKRQRTSDVESTVVDGTFLSPRPPSTAQQPGTPTSLPPGRPTTMQEPSTHSQSTTPHASLKFFLQPLNTYVASLGGFAALEPRLEQPRMRLLQNACNREDCFYLCLHQIFCLCQSSPSTVPTLPQFREEHFLGFGIVSQLLLSNQNLPKRSLDWFAQFPGPIEGLLQNSQLYQSAYEDVRNSLVLLSSNWEKVNGICATRSYPPLVDDLIMELGIKSVIFQQIAFTALYRRQWGTASNELAGLLDALFIRNQTEHQARAVHPLPRSAHTENNRLIGEYRALHLEKYRGENRGQMANPGQVQHVRVLPSSGPPVSQPAHVSPAPPIGNFHIPSRQINPNLVPNPQQFPQLSPYLGPPTEQSAPTPFPTQVRRRGRPPTRVTPQSAQGEGQRRRGRPPIAQADVMRQATQNTLASVQMGAPIGPGQPQIWIGPIQAAYQQQQLPHSHPQPYSHAQSGSPFLLPPDSLNPSLAIPNPSMTAMHQCQLQSPPIEARTLHDLTGQKSKLYMYPAGFVLAPQCLGASSPMFTLRFDIGIGDFQRRAVDVASARKSSMTRVILDGTILYRLRCVKVPSPKSAIDESEWTVADNTWPSAFYPKLNGTNLELRRKFHHGKDLPVDLTRLVRAGVNELELAFLRTDMERISTFYAVAVVVVQAASHERAKGKVSVLSMESSLSSITASLNRLASDDDIQVVDNHISIDLMDPFTAKIFNVPARGKRCLHRECFDLDTFLETRKSKRKDGPTMPDEWRCPICGSDVRPQSLIVDEFLLHVRNTLNASNNLEARAILVKQDGSWEAKFLPRESTVEPSKEDGMGGGSSVENVHGLANGIGANVIALDDD
jgi:hypothetical protein